MIFSIFGNMTNTKIIIGNVYFLELVCLIYFYFMLLLYTTIINLKLTYLMSNAIREIGFNNYLFYKKMNINLAPLKFSFNFCFLFHFEFFT